MTNQRLMFICMVILGTIIAIVIANDMIDVKTCLDSKGQWDPKTKVCEHKVH